MKPLFSKSCVLSWHTVFYANFIDGLTVRFHHRNLVQKKNSLWKSFTGSGFYTAPQVYVPINHINTSRELAGMANKCSIFAVLSAFWVLTPCVMYSSKWFSIPSLQESQVVVSFPTHVISLLHSMEWYLFTFGVISCAIWILFRKSLTKTYILKVFFINFPLEISVLDVILRYLIIFH